MPIYEYQCRACGHRLETIQSFSEEPLKDCPVCGKPELSKEISAPAFQLKGTGWYVTDFKDSGKKKEGSGGSGETTKADSTKKE